MLSYQSLHNSGKSFFNISITLALETCDPIIGTVLASLMNRDTMISVLYIA